MGKTCVCMCERVNLLHLHSFSDDLDFRLREYLSHNLSHIFLPHLSNLSPARPPTSPLCRQLMKCVRLPLLRRDFLMSNVDTELLVRHHSECKDLLIEALKYHLMPEQRGVLSNSRTRPRRCEGASPVLFAVGQCAPEGTH